MPRFLDRQTLTSIAGRSPVAVAVGLAAAIGHSSSQYFEVDEVHPEVLLPTYRRRLARWLDGDGPSVVGLDHFVETLVLAQAPVQIFVISEGATSYVGLLDAHGDELIDAISVTDDQA